MDAFENLSANWIYPRNKDNKYTLCPTVNSNELSSTGAFGLLWAGVALFANKKSVNIRQGIKTRHEIDRLKIRREFREPTKNIGSRLTYRTCVPKGDLDGALGRTWESSFIAAIQPVRVPIIRCNAVSIIATKRSTNNRIVIANAFICFSFKGYPRDFRTFSCPVTLYTSRYTRSPFSP